MFRKLNKTINGRKRSKRFEKKRRKSLGLIFIFFQELEKDKYCGLLHCVISGEMMSTTLTNAYRPVCNFHLFLMLVTRLQKGHEIFSQPHCKHRMFKCYIHPFNSKKNNKLTCLCIRTMTVELLGAPNLQNDSGQLNG
jgi:hypothetical protein